MAGEPSHGLLMPEGSAQMAPLAGASDAGMATGLCLAILVALLLGLAAWMAARRRRPQSDHLLRLLPTNRPWARDPDPPSLAVLSVWRC